MKLRVADKPVGRPPARLVRFMAAGVVLAGALAYGRAQRAPDLITPAREIFPESERVETRQGILHLFDLQGNLVGWAGSGSADGYGGPMLLVVGVDPLGAVAGVRVVEQRETPVFWRMVKAGEYFQGITGTPYDRIDFEYRNVVAVTGATVSSDAIVESIRGSVAQVAAVAFEVSLPLPERPFGMSGTST